MTEKFIIMEENMLYLGIKYDYDRKTVTIGGRTKFRKYMEEFLIDFMGFKEEQIPEEPLTPHESKFSKNIVKLIQTQKNKIKFVFPCKNIRILYRALDNYKKHHGYYIAYGVSSLERIMC